ncbi:hypothetical protein HanHA300_Chr01g0006111 [Helianthus annuus]|nr:hypothetical protein HanHA300_Chr01g0006111 [Helianthus annuus]
MSMFYTHHCSSFLVYFLNQCFFFVIGSKLPEVQKFLNASACSWYQQVIGTCWYSFSVDWAEIGISKDQPYLSKNRFD